MDLTPQQRRDRELAGRVHYGRRQAVPVEALVKGMMDSPQMRRIRRQRFLVAALREVLSERELAHVQAQSWNGKGLTLAVDSSPLLAELRQFRYQQLLDACLRHGVGVSTIRFRRARQPPANNR